MWKSRFSEQQISDALRRANAGEAVTEICKQMGVSRQGFYLWRSKYEGMGMMQKRLRWLDEENHKLKRLIADLSLETHVLRDELIKAVLPSNGNSALHILGDQSVKLQEVEQEPALV